MPTVSGWNFDWDDNIFYMPTDVVLYNKTTDGVRTVSTAEFATARVQLGQPGEWEAYEVRDDSFRYFRDGANGRNHFREDIDKAIGGNNPVWVGPSWDPFQFALSRPETAQRVTIITARGHSRPAMLDGLRFLQARGYFRHLPPEENLYAVSHPDFAGSAADPSAIKADVMKDIIDEIEKLPIDTDASVRNRDGDGSALLHLWGFSDDDWGNFEAAQDELSKEVEKGRWKKVKITVFFTGIHDLSHEPCRLVIKSDGSLRDQLPEEAHEGELATLGGESVSLEEAAPVKAGKMLWEKDVCESIKKQS